MLAMVCWLAANVLTTNMFVFVSSCLSSDLWKIIVQILHDLKLKGFPIHGQSNLIKGRKNKRKVGDRSVDPTMISKQNLSPTTHTLEASTINDTDGCKCDDAVKVEDNQLH